VLELKWNRLVFFVILLGLCLYDRSMNAADMTTLDKFEALQEDYILNGKSNGDPALNASLTRAELAAILVRMYKLEPITYQNSYSDTINHWAQLEGYIEAVNNAHLMEGISRGIFDPDSKLTKEQLAAILLKALKIDPSVHTALPQGNFSPWANNIVATALKEHLIGPSDDYTRFIDRGETIDILYPLYLKIKPDPKVYNLELSRWNIYNDATHPIETTDGFNRALQWAQEQDYNVFKVPAGTYLISKGTDQYDKNARINMVSNMTFLLDDNTVIKKETNEYIGYSLLYIGPSIHDVTLKGGTYIGDRDTHDYSSGGTHEFGFGVLAEGAKKINIDGIKSFKFTGDGVYVGSHFDVINSLFENDFESGGIDDNGNLVADPQRIRIKNLPKTNLNLKKFPGRKTIELERPTGITDSNSYDIYFYKADGTYIRRLKDQEFYWSYISIPEGADYFNAIIHESAPEGTNRNVVGGDGIYGMGVYAKTKSENVTIKNSESAFNRRQGITIAGGDNILVKNNILHDIEGTAPQSGIDVEGGIHPNTNLIITNNQFYNNKRYNLILFDGKDAVVDGNQFGPAPIGLAISNPFTGAMVKNNTFDGSGITVAHDASFINNKISNGNVGLAGKGITVIGLELTDSSLAINSSIPFGIKVSDVTLTNTGAKQNTSLNIYGQPIQLTNATIQGPTTRVFGGNVSSGSIYNNLKVIGYDAKLNLDLPPGSYNNCLFEPKTGGVQPAELNDAEIYEFNSCKFKMDQTALVINNKDSIVSLSNSSFEVQASTGYRMAVIEIHNAKEITVENNTFDTKNNIRSNFGVIKIVKSAGVNTLGQVQKATIKNNTIYSNIAIPGISTIDGGNNAPPYRIENNVLYKAFMQLKGNDININNKEISNDRG
jgi:hypothetical protein